MGIENMCVVATMPECEKNSLFSLRHSLQTVMSKLGTKQIPFMVTGCWKNSVWNELELMGEVFFLFCFFFYKKD